jgi:hypothetical protein
VIAYRFDNFHKNNESTIDRPYAEFKKICNTLAIVTEISEYSLSIIIKKNSEEIALYGIILNESQLGIDDGSGYRAREKDIGFVPEPN